MYFPVGWPKHLELQDCKAFPISVFCNRDRSLFGILTEDSISVWFIRPCVEITCFKRSKESISAIGINQLAEWKPDSLMIVVSTSCNHLIFFNVDIDDSIKCLYEQVDSKVSGLKRESDELFLKEKVPPISLDPVYTLCLGSEICSIVCIRDELVVTSKDGYLWRVQWDGKFNEDYTLNLCNISFFLDQLQSRGSTFHGAGIYVRSMEYSPIIGGFSVVLSNGQASFITASSLKFEPHQVFGILAQDIQNATCTAVNHRYRLIAYGLKNAQGVVFCVDDISGALQSTHQLILSSKDFPDVSSAAGAVSNLKWTPDGGALAMTWDKGGLAIWSVFGALLMCSLGWDYGSADIMKNVMKLISMEWGPEGYQLWGIKGKSTEENVEHNKKGKEKKSSVILFQFAKSALTVNPGMTGREHVFLQAEDRLYVSAGADIIHNKPSALDHKQEQESALGISREQMLVGNKQWIIIPIPYAYLGNNWPIRYTAIDSQGQSMAVAGRSGLAHYSLTLRRWKLFGNETQEKDFVVMGGLLWWEDQIILGCYNLRDLRDEIRVYPQESKLDNQFVRVVKMDSQVLQLSALGDRLLSFCADSHLTLFLLQRKTSPTSSVLHVTRLLELDVTNLVFHPACVVSALLTSLCSETVRWPRKGDESILLNICGRLLLLQQDPVSRTADITNNNTTQKIPSYGLPTVLASCVENVWVCSHSSKDTPHLTEALWIACGAHGLRVWLPLFPHDGEKQRAHNFMSKRIMLPVPVYIYPLAVLYEDAVLLGAENETVLLSADSYRKKPFCIVSRTSQVYLHHILRQLLKRNLGYHAWEIARSCSTLPYFPHSLELLLHEILEEEATSSDPIPDALLPRVIDFIQEFPVFLQTVVQCARKTELALWPYLFSAVGNPKNLFQACLNQGQLDTAASYLIILQNLELSTVSQQYATLLLESALEAGKWELANELVRFLKAIDPSDNEALPRSFNLPNKYGLPHSTPPVSPTEDDLSFVLGTVSLTRNRSHSTTVTQKLNSSNPDKTRVQHQDITRTISDPHNIPRKRRISEHKEKAVSEELFIDSLLSRHAQKLLSCGKLKDLGYFAAYLDFHLVTFFTKERNQAAHVDDFMHALFTLHQDFQWPFPLSSTIYSYSQNKNSEAIHSFLEQKTHLEDSNFKPFSSSVKQNILNSCIIQDNGYSSNQSGKLENQNVSNLNSNLSLDTATEHTVDAHLAPKQRGGSVLTLDVSENSSLWTEESLTTLDEENLSNLPLSLELEAISEELANKGPIQTEVQLRYLLQLLLEAGCLDWSLLIAIVLRDAMAVIRVVNLAKQPDQLPDTLHHLKGGMACIEQWAEKECPGYKNFMLAIHSQAKALSKISSPSSSLLKLDMQHSTDDYCNDILYDKEKSSHRLSTSSDIPGIEGTLVLQTSNVSKEDENSSSESEESSDSQTKENQTSECSIC